MEEEKAKEDKEDKEDKEEKVIVNEDSDNQIQNQPLSLKSEHISKIVDDVCEIKWIIHRPFYDHFEIPFVKRIICPRSTSISSSSSNPIKHINKKLKVNGNGNGNEKLIKKEKRKEEKEKLVGTIKENKHVTKKPKYIVKEKIKKLNHEFINENQLQQHSSSSTLNMGISKFEVIQKLKRNRKSKQLDKFYHLKENEIYTLFQNQFKYNIINLPLSSENETLNHSIISISNVKCKKKNLFPIPFISNTIAKQIFLEMKMKSETLQWFDTIEILNNKCTFGTFCIHYLFWSNPHKVNPTHFQEKWTLDKIQE